MNVEELVRGVETRQTSALARAISAVENGREGFEELLGRIHSRTGRAHRIGITGPPGAGKSTLTEALVRHYRSLSQTVAVIAVDPTSPFTGGALLGDRIRMEEVSLDDGVFIRSMATRGSLGGLATTTREVADILDAAGFEHVLVETVGVGQSELDVSRLADSTVLVLVPESGDGIQTLKSGIMEAADLYVVNKADRAGADKLIREIEITLGLRRGKAYRHVPAHHGIRAGHRGAKAEGATPADPAWAPPVLATVAVRQEGVEPLADALARHFEWLESTGQLQERRRRRTLERTREVVERAARRRLWQETDAEARIAERLPEIMSGDLSPYTVAARILDDLGQGAKP